MGTSTLRAPLAVVGSCLACTAAIADSDRSSVSFADFTPLAISAPPTADEAAPITFGNPIFRQR